MWTVLAASMIAGNPSGASGAAVDLDDDPWLRRPPVDVAVGCYVASTWRSRTFGDCVRESQPGVDLMVIDMTDRPLDAVVTLSDPDGSNAVSTQVGLGFDMPEIALHREMYTADWAVRPTLLRVEVSDPTGAWAAADLRSSSTDRPTLCGTWDVERDTERLFVLVRVDEVDGRLAAWVDSCL